MGDLEIRPLTADRFHDLAALFGQGGDPKTCWCQFWRVPGREGVISTAAKNRARMRAMADDDPPAGLLGYRRGEVVGWVSLGPREVFGRLERSKVRPRLDDVPVWSIVCFVVARAARNQGIARDLLEAAVEFARTRGAPAVEGYPVDTAGERAESARLYVGTLSMFEDAGFRVVREVEVPGAKVRRVIVRRELA